MRVIKKKGALIFLQLLHAPSSFKHKMGKNQKSKAELTDETLFLKLKL